MNFKSEIETNGYELLITREKKIGSNSKENGVSKDISVYLNEKINDFKVMYTETVKNKSSYSEWTVQDARENLDNNHPLLMVINKLEQFKQLDNGISNMEIKPKKRKI